jgi:cleavage and polyadenylation specificity factor subunit 1
MKETDGAWSIHTKDSKSKSQSTSYDRYLVLSKSKPQDKEESVVYAMGSNGLEEMKAPEFNPNGDRTIDIGTLAAGNRVVQVLKTEVRTYDCGKHNYFGFRLLALCRRFWRILLHIP